MTVTAIQALRTVADHCEALSRTAAGDGALLYDRLASALRSDAGALAEIDAIGDGDGIRVRIEQADSFLFT